MHPETASLFLQQLGRFNHDVLNPALTRWRPEHGPLPQTLAPALAGFGFMGMRAAVADGGMGAGFSLQAAACEMLAEVDFGVAMSCINTHNVVAKLSAHATPSIKSRLLPPLLQGRASACTALTEPACGSDFAAITTQAQRRGDSWRLNGEKRWIINAAHASGSIVYAQTGSPGDRHGIAAFWVDLDAAGAQRYALDDCAAPKHMGTGGFRLRNVDVPDSQLLVAPGLAFKSIMQELNAARTYVAAMAVGMLSAACESARQYGIQRQSFGAPLAQHQAWRFAFAHSQVALAGARALLQQAITAIDEHHDASLLSAQAKLNATAACRTHVAQLMHLMGAEGLQPQHPFARHLTAAQVAGLTDGSDEMLLERVAQLSLRKPAQ